MSKKLISIVLAILLCLCNIQVSFAQEKEPTYIIGAEQSEDGYTVTISIANASATVGRFALEYDKEKVTLLDKSGAEPTSDTPTVKDIVSNEECITIPAQSAEDGQGVSVSDGYIMFAWYATGTRVEAEDETVDIAKIRFALNDGVTAGDFNSATFRLRTIVPGVYHGWWSGAQIATGSYSHYWNNVDGFGQCAVVKSYENCDVLPIVTYSVSFSVTDGEGSPVSDATIVVDATEKRTDESGKLTTDVPVGAYGYTVSKSGYESKSGIVDVKDGDVSQDIVIRTDMQYVTDTIQSIDIIYADGDNADSVTQSVGLPFDDINGATLSWKSSNSNVITDSGGVVRPKNDTRVTLTLTITKGEASVSRDFGLTVLKIGIASPSGSGGGGNNSANVPSSRDDGDDVSSYPETPVIESDKNNINDKTQNNDEPENGTKTDTVPDFKDLNNHLWAKEAIMTLAKSGVIKGTSDTTFEPGNAIKRGDFVTLLVRMFELEADFDGNFADVPKDSYYYNEIATARALGIAQGLDDEHFMPQANISRQDMMVIVHRAMKLYGITLEETSASVLDEYSDKAYISDYAVSSVIELVGNGLISGNDNNEINPLGMTTRAEVAVFLYRIYRI